MAVTFGFYNSINKDRAYNAVQISQIFDGLIKDGIYQNFPNPDDHLKVRAGSGMTVIVGPGRAWFNHTWTYNDSDYILKIDPSDYQSSRIDAIVLKVDRSDAVRANDIYTVTGTVSDNPEPPTFENTDTIFYHVLAYVTVNAGVEQLSDTDIEDRTGYEETGCGFVDSLLTKISVDDLMHQWVNEWNEYKVRKRNEYENWITTQENDMMAWTANQKALYLEWLAEMKAMWGTEWQEFLGWESGKKQQYDEWFDNLHYILDGDVAGHLQVEIEKIWADEFNRYYELVNQTTEMIRTGDYITEIRSQNTDESVTMNTHINISDDSDIIEIITTVSNGVDEYTKTVVIDGNIITESYTKY